MSFGDQIFLVLLGFGIVLSVLSLLWLISAGVGKVFAARASAVASAASAAPGPPVASAALQPAGVPSAHVAAISAAVAVITGGRGRVVSVRIPPHQAGAWAQSGRIEQYSSHNMHWNWAIPGPPHVDHTGAVHHEPPPPSTREK